MNENALAAGIKKLAREAGYSACGITSAEPFAGFEEAVRRLMQKHPETAGLYRPLLDRVDPRRRAPWVKSIVVCVRWYGKYRLPPGAVGLIGRNYLADRRFAGCPDNAMPKLMKKGLAGLGLRVKAGGVPERWAAARAGVGRFGKNCFIYSEHGSWINIESWRVDAELPPDRPATAAVCPENCTRCIDACPTRALEAPFSMRMDRCVAYLTYHAPEPIDPALDAAMGRWIYGCDVCQAVCPLNNGKWQEDEPAQWQDEVAHLLTAGALARMDQATYERLILPRFPYIPADRVDRWHSNARRSLEQEPGRG